MFEIPKTIRQNATHYFIVKRPNKIQLQQIVLNHSSDFEFKNLMKPYTKKKKKKKW